MAGGDDGRGRQLGSEAQARRGSQRLSEGRGLPDTLCNGICVEMLSALRMRLQHTAWRHSAHCARAYSIQHGDTLRTPHTPTAYSTRNPHWRACALYTWLCTHAARTGLSRSRAWSVGSTGCCTSCIACTPQTRHSSTRWQRYACALYSTCTASRSRVRVRVCVSHGFFPMYLSVAMLLLLKTIFTPFILVRYVCV